MIYIIAAMVFYTLVILVGAQAARNAETNLVNAIINTVSAIIPIGIFISVINQGFSQSSKYGLIMSVATGVLVALFGLALTKSYSTDKVAIVAPVVFGGAIFLSAILSAVLFKEKISMLQGVGLILMGIGLAFIIYTKSTNAN